MAVHSPGKDRGYPLAQRQVGRSLALVGTDQGAGLISHAASRYG
jgi:hypothetical protein